MCSLVNETVVWFLGACDPTQCRNGGTCHTLGPAVNDFLCLCPDNFFGESCELGS